MADAVCPPAPFLYSISRFFVSGAGYSGTTMRWSTALTPKPAASNCLLAGSLNGKCTDALITSWREFDLGMGAQAALEARQKGRKRCAEPLDHAHQKCQTLKS